MDIILCGGGDIGSAAAEMLTAGGESVTLIDLDERKTKHLNERLDISTIEGSASSASILSSAGVARADAVIATTDVDEVNLVICDIAASLGAVRTMARVDHSMFLQDEQLDYAAVFSVDRLFSPDRAMASAMASRLRNPAALAIEHFASNEIELQQIPVDPQAQAVGQPLRTLAMPRGARLAAITRRGEAALPSADDTVEGGDVVTLVAERMVFPAMRQLFTKGTYGRRTIAISGGPPAAVWLCRFLKDRAFDIRLFEVDRDRAEELGEKLDWITVINSDPAQPEIFDEEQLHRVDAFVSMRSDEQNMLACAYAKRSGVENVMPVMRHAEFLPLLEELGIDRTWNPRDAAAQAIGRFLRCHEFERIDGFFNDSLELMRLRVGCHAELIGRTLASIGDDPPLLVLACEDDEGTPFVPGGDLEISVGRHMIVLTTTAKAGLVRTLLDVGGAR
ncbi:MAG: Trk system potassium transporter TrkA [Phycisphaerales bacterium]|jgi:trk system potassium uptake protein TrkA|nr:Trk system potassium transporter TrkA [Phycisphaerales bacterium]